MSIRNRIKRLEKRRDTLTVDSIPWEELTDEELQEIIAWPICGVSGDKITEQEMGRLAKGANPADVIGHYPEFNPEEP